MKSHYKTNIKIPFINTTIPTDVLLLVVFIPLWWVLGLDQIIWIVMSFWIFLKLMMINKAKFKLIPTTKLMVIFLLVIVVSSCFIEESYRVLTFIRNYSAFISVTILVICLTNTVRSEKQIRRLLWAFGIFSFFASLLGVLAITNIFNPHFEAPSKYLIPEGLKSFGLVRAIYTKAISTIDFSRWGMFIRPTSFFIGSTAYGTSLVIVIPLTYFLMTSKKGIKKFFWFITFILLLINLIFNASRGAILSLFIATVFFIYKKMQNYKKIIITFFLMIILLFIYSSFGYESIHQSVINFRGGSAKGSKEDRMVIYKATIEQVLSRPFFGYGTQRDMPDISFYPVGSHSGYLGVLYRYGIAGFLLYILILFSIYKYTKVTKNQYLNNKFLAKCVEFSSISYYANLLHQIVEEPDLDIMSLHIIWLSFAILITSNRLLRNCSENNFVLSNKV